MQSAALRECTYCSPNVYHAPNALMNGRDRHEMTSAATKFLDKKLDRIRRHSGVGVGHPDERSLLHAYIACLSIEELCSTIVATLAEPSELRLALRRRLLRLLREEAVQAADLAKLVALVEQSQAHGRAHLNVRPAVDALLSALFAFLPFPQQQSVLDAWIDRGSRGASARWLKATKEVPSLFDEEVAMAYWRSTGDARAAKSLAYQGSAAFLRTIIAELLAACEEGWIISRAVIRAETVDEPVWSTIRERHPATYLYLCARLHRHVSNSEALKLVCACSNVPMNETRGLAIWAVGQMGLVEVLDRVVERATEFQKKDMADYERYLEQMS